MLDSPWIFPGKDPMEPLNNPTKTVSSPPPRWTSADCMIVAMHLPACALTRERRYQVPLRGHASSVTTQRYAHLAWSTLRNTSQLVSNLVNKA
jgi:hypothetical protein